MNFKRALEEHPVIVVASFAVGAFVTAGSLFALYVLPLKDATIEQKEAEIQNKSAFIELQGGLINSLKREMEERHYASNSIPDSLILTGSVDKNLHMVQSKEVLSPTVLKMFQAIPILNGQVVISMATLSDSLGLLIGSDVLRVPNRAGEKSEFLLNGDKYTLINHGIDDPAVIGDRNRGIKISVYRQ